MVMRNWTLISVASKELLAGSRVSPVVVARFGRESQSPEQSAVMRQIQGGAGKLLRISSVAKHWPGCSVGWARSRGYSLD